MITIEQLQVIYPKTKAARLALFADPLNDAMQEFGIATRTEVQMFLAQIGHESMGLVYTAEIWGPTPAQAGYASRADLGNTREEAIEVARRHGMSVGRFFAGHGLIQTTGYDNHCEVRDALGIDCVENPLLLTEPSHAARSAALYWQRHGCPALAARNDFKAVTRAINGGLNGLDDRYAYLTRAMVAIDAADTRVGLA